jgi:hypothetical protein
MGLHLHQSARLVASLDETVRRILFSLLALPRRFDVAMASVRRANIAPRSIYHNKYSERINQFWNHPHFCNHAGNKPVSIISRSSGMALTHSTFSAVFNEHPFTPAHPNVTNVSKNAHHAQTNFRTSDSHQCTVQASPVSASPLCYP